MKDSKDFSLWIEFAKNDFVSCQRIGCGKTFCSTGNPGSLSAGVRKIFKGIFTP